MGIWAHSTVCSLIYFLLISSEALHGRLRFATHVSGASSWRRSTPSRFVPLHSNAIKTLERPTKQRRRLPFESIVELLRLYNSLHNLLNDSITRAPPPAFVVPSTSPWPQYYWGVRLGSLVVDIQRGRSFTSDSCRKQLNEINFVWSAFDVKFLRLMEALRAYRAMMMENAENPTGAAGPSSSVDLVEKCVLRPLQVPVTFVFPRAEFDSTARSLDNRGFPTHLSGYRLGYALASIVTKLRRDEVCLSSAPNTASNERKLIAVREKLAALRSLGVCTSKDGTGGITRAKESLNTLSSVTKLETLQEGAVPRHVSNVGIDLEGNALSIRRSRSYDRGVQNRVGTILSALRCFVAEFGHAAVPWAFRVPLETQVASNDTAESRLLWPLECQGLALGRAVAAMRREKRLLDAQKTQQDASSAPHRDKMAHVARELLLKHKTEIDKLGFVWDVDAFRTRRLTIALSTFKRIYGHTLVPVTFRVPENGNATTHPVFSRRYSVQTSQAVQNPDDWPAETRGLALGRQLARLARARSLRTGDALTDIEEAAASFSALPRREQHFANILDALLVHYELFGDMLVPRYFVVPAEPPWSRRTWGLQLGNRVRNIRSGKSYTAPKYRSMLQAVGFDTFTESWKKHEETMLR